MDKLIRVTYHLRPDQLVSLEGLKAKTGCPVAETIRRAVDEYLRDREWTTNACTGKEGANNKKPEAQRT